MGFIFGLHLLLVIAITIWGANKRIGALGAFLWSFFLTPFIGVIVVAASGIRMWECDFCDHKQEKEFTICPKCKKDPEGFTEEESREIRIRKEIEDEIIRGKIRKEINSKKD